MWIYDCNPLADGDYSVIMRNGSETKMPYTREGGWNTFYTHKGRLIGFNMNDAVIGWFNPAIREV